MATPEAGFDRTDFNALSSARSLGFEPTSGYRTQAHQDYLISRGLTDTRHSSHTRGDAYDFRPPPGMSQNDAIALARRTWPGSRVQATNGGAIHVTFPGYGRAQDVSGSRRRYGGR